MKGQGLPKSGDDFGFFFFSDGVTFTSNYREEAGQDTTNHSANRYTSAQGVYQGFFPSFNYRKGEKMKPNEKRV